MKTPDEIKKGLECCPGQYFGVSCGNCLYSNDGVYCGENGVRIMKDALEYIEQLEANYRQVSKALCNKDNATLEEVLQAIAQVKSELAAVKRERDAAIEGLRGCGECEQCKYKTLEAHIEPCKTCLYMSAEGLTRGKWQWRGVCPENTEVQDENQH